MSSCRLIVHFNSLELAPHSRATLRQNLRLALLVLLHFSSFFFKVMRSCNLDLRHFLRLFIMRIIKKRKKRWDRGWRSWRSRSKFIYRFLCNCFVGILRMLLKVHWSITLSNVGVQKRSHGVCTKILFLKKGSQHMPPFVEKYNTMLVMQLRKNSFLYKYV